MSERKSADTIRALRGKHPEMRARDFARIHGIAEAELVAAQIGHDDTRALRPDLGLLLNGLTEVGEIMALTRNESCVSEKIGQVERVEITPHAAMTLGADIDLRIFPRHWRFGFSTTRQDKEGRTHRALQFFDAQGQAVHKVHARPGTDIAAWNRLVETLALPDQSDTIAVEPEIPPAPAPESLVDAAELRRRWRAMTDTHQLFGLLRELKLTRLAALDALGPDIAWELDHAAVARLFEAAAEQQVKLMAFVSNRGCTQIHGGTVHKIQMMGPWLNVLDPGFHMHLRLDQVARVWAVRKPTRDGELTSVEVFDAQGEAIIQLFGQRGSGQPEPADWRALAESLPAQTLTRSA
ncbi:hemin-degrading factor [Devosia sp.]|uniref:hemin-degrading factor n=1 Tax=Devosia sp. TaxID=1871048 RepID=UPI002AFF70F9|nr:ChuX/HutX family heme-like substrate-binding protein [Devosia sp.]